MFRSGAECDPGARILGAILTPERFGSGQAAAALSGCPHRKTYEVLLDCN